MPDQPPAISAKIRAEMAARGVRQRQLADALGIAQSQISARLCGVIDWRLGEIEAVARVLGVDPADLLGRAA